MLEYKLKYLQIADNTAITFKESSFANIELIEEGIVVSLNAIG